MNKTYGIILITAIIGFTAWLLRNKFKKFISYLTYSLSFVRVHQVSLTETWIKAGVKIENPSETSATLKDYKAELYLINGQTRSLLASTPVSTLSVPAKTTFTKTFDFKFKSKQLLNLILTVISKGVDALKGNLIIVVKADVMGQFVTKEFTY